MNFELELNGYQINDNSIVIDYDLWDEQSSVSVKQEIKKSTFLDYLENAGDCIEDLRDYGRAIITEFLIYLFGRAE